MKPNPAKNRFRSSSLAAGALAAALTPALGCSAPEPASDTDDVGVVYLSLTAPSGVGCIRTRFAGAREVTRDVTVSSEVTTRLDGLPTGSVAVTSAAYAGSCGDGDPLWLSEPLKVTLRAGRPLEVQIVFRKNGIALVSTRFIDDECPEDTMGGCGAVNLALNRSCNGFPSPLESDRGWGGGSYPCEIVDGLHAYDNWAHGLAFTGGHRDASGGPPYIEPAGIRRAVIDFGSPKSFDKIIIWWHGSAYTPQTGTIEYWDGTQWVAASSVARNYGTMHAEGSNSGYSDSDIYTFAPVLGSKVRYSFDNSLYNIDGSWNIHGWIYEVEVFATR